MRAENKDDAENAKNSGGEKSGKKSCERARGGGGRRDAGI